MEQMRQEDETEIDLAEVFFWLRQKVWLILLSAVFVGILAFAGTKLLVVPQYRATTKIHVVSKEQSITSLSLSDLQMGSQLTKDYMVIIESRPVLDQVIKNLNLSLTYQELLDILTINNIKDTRMIEITAEYPDPVVVKQLVDEVASVSSTRIAEIMDSNEPNVVEEGYQPEAPCSPSLKKNVLIGLLLGAMLSAAIIIIKNLLDDRIKSAEDIEKYLGINTLSTIPIIKNAEEEKKHE